MSWIDLDLYDGLPVCKKNKKINEKRLRYCIILSCDKLVFANKRCKYHYHRSYKDKKKRKANVPFQHCCAVAFCSRKIHALNLCDKHYRYVKRHRKKRKDFCRLCPIASVKVVYMNRLCRFHYSDSQNGSKRNKQFKRGHCSRDELMMLNALQRPENPPFLARFSRGECPSLY